MKVKFGVKERIRIAPFAPAVRQIMLIRVDPRCRYVSIARKIKIPIKSIYVNHLEHSP